MIDKYMGKLKGKYCKIVAKEHSECRSNVITGIIEEINYLDGFIIIDSSTGVGRINIDTIIAIKSKNNHKN
jgi:hypothetical protein